MIKQVKGIEGGLATSDVNPQDWTLTASGPTDGVTGVTDADEITEAAVAPGEYVLTEQATGEGPANAYDKLGNWSCVINDGSPFDLLEDSTVKVGPGESVVCTVTNQAAEITILKKAEGPLSAEDFVVSAVASSHGLPGLDEAAGSLIPSAENSLIVKPGEKYTASESLASGASAAYLQRAFERYTESDDDACPKVPTDKSLESDDCWVATEQDEVSAAQGDREFYRFVNFQPEGPKLPMTGGQSAALFTAIGLVVLGGAGGAAAIARRRRTS